ncbi:MAG: helix-turn-helix domain-containing protein [Lachnospiraceae bacterium]
MNSRTNYTNNNTSFIIDTNHREVTPHGTDDFPCVEYLDTYYNSFYPWHWHDEIELAYVETGSLTVSVNNQRHTLTAGEGIFINSGVLHGFAGMENTSCVFPNLLFRPALLYGTQDSIFWTRYMSPLINAVHLSHIIFNKEIPWQAELTQHIRLAFAALSDKPFGYEISVRNHLSELLLLLCKNYSVESRDCEPTNLLNVNRLRLMLDFVQNHYMHPIEVEQIAEASSISKRECLRCFDSIIGISPKQYVIELRIQKAKELLSSTSLSILETCERCGFQDQSYFTKTFREKTGSPPGKWRKSK